MCYVRVCLSKTKTKPNEFGEIGGEINIQGQLTGECDWGGGETKLELSFCVVISLSVELTVPIATCVCVCVRAAIGSPLLLLLVSLSLLLLLFRRAAAAVGFGVIRWGHATAPSGICTHGPRRSQCAFIYLFLFSPGRHNSYDTLTRTHTHTHA